MGRISDQANQRAMAKHGGMPPAVLTDAETGKVMYDNRDATAMAKLFAAKGGFAADQTDVDTNRWVRAMEAEHLMSKVQCQHCKSSIELYHSTVYINGFRCWNCWKDNEPFEKTEDWSRIEEVLEFTEKYLDLHSNNVQAKKEALRVYLTALGRLKVEE